MPDIWMDVDTALSEVPVNILPLIDDTDFKTREESVVYNQAGLDLVWNFITTAGAMTQTAVTPTDTAGDYDWVNQGNGLYSIEIPASGGASINNDTEGFGWFTGFATGILPWRGPVIGFRAAGLNDALIDSAYSTTRGLAGTALPAAAADAAGGLPISDAGGLDLDAKLATATSALATSSALATAQADLDILTGADGAIIASGTQTFNMTGNITGNLSGSVGSVTGAVGSVTGAVGSVTGNVGGNVAGSVGSVTGNVGGNVVGSVASVTGAINTAAGTITTLDGLDTAQDTQHATTLSKLLKYVQLILRKDSAIATDNATELTAINANGGSGAGAYANTTDSQEGIRDNTAWNTATTVDLNADQSGVTIGTVTTNTDMRGTDGASTHSAADVWTAVTRTLTANTNLNDPTPAAIADAVWDEATSGHVGAGTTGKALTDTLADTNELQTNQGNWLTATGFSTHSAADVWAAVTRTLTANTNLNDPTAAAIRAEIDSNSTQLAAIASDAASLNDTKIPDTLSLANINAQVDSAFTTQMADSVSTDGTIATREQALYMILQFLTEFGISGTTLTARKVDGSTALMTFTLDDATNPTSITRAS